MIEETASRMDSSKWQAEMENAIINYAFDIEREALKQGLYTGFRAARELLIGVT